MTRRLRFFLSGAAAAIAAHWIAWAFTGQWDPGLWHEQVRAVVIFIAAPALGAAAWLATEPPL